jgi:hypothetical protein
LPEPVEAVEVEIVLVAAAPEVAVVLLQVAVVHVVVMRQLIPLVVPEVVDLKEEMVALE